MSEVCHICERESGPGERELNESGLCLHCQISHELLQDVTSGDQERIEKLESAMQRFVDRTNKALWPDQVPVYIEAFYDECKQLLNEGKS